MQTLSISQKIRVLNRKSTKQLPTVIKAIYQQTIQHTIILKNLFTIIEDRDEAETDEP